MVISVSGERTILVYHAPRQYELPGDLPAARWLYLTSMAKGSESILTKLATYLGANGTKLAFQPGTYQLRQGPGIAHDILGQVEFIIMNKEEAQLYTGQNEADAPALLDHLHALGPKIAVVTDATKGSYAFDGTKRWYLGTRPEIPRIEATGAGDAYASAFAVALLEGESIPQAMRWGTMNAESVIQKIGPQAGILTKQQLRDELDRNPEFVTKEI
jgi:ribokinase